MSRTVQLPAHAPVTERDFQRAVIDSARVYGWAVYHPWLSAHSERGWPDLALVRPPRLVLAELKSESGKLMAGQEKWLGLLGQVTEPPEVHIWRPKDIGPDGLIMRVLMREWQT